MFKHAKDFDKAYTVSFDQGLRNYFLMIYTYMTLGLLITSGAAFATLNFPPLVQLMFQTFNGVIVGINSFGYFISFVPLIISIYFFAGFGSMSLDKARTLFWVYCFTTGISLSYLGLLYTGHSIVKGLLITTSAFGAISLYGYTTKTDLSRYGAFLFAGVIALLMFALSNFLFYSGGLNMIVSLIGIIVFMGFIAWDNQRIKQIYYQAPNAEMAQKYAIISAFNLYLNFLNLFLYLMRFIGDRKN